jgi:hypothetical protein
VGSLTQLYILVVIHEVMLPTAALRGGVVNLDNVIPAQSFEVTG